MDERRSVHRRQQSAHFAVATRLPTDRLVLISEPSHPRAQRRIGAARVRDHNMRTENNSLSRLTTITTRNTTSVRWRNIVLGHNADRMLAHSPSLQRKHFVHNLFEVNSGSIIGYAAGSLSNAKYFQGRGWTAALLEHPLVRARFPL